MKIFLLLMTKNNLKDMDVLSGSSSFGKIYQWQM